jgi:UDP-2-acetamido-2,6-beta-L-arabino-hexul-4-ose reductase
LVTVAVTGSRGFIGKNLLEALARREDIVVRTYDVDSIGDLRSLLEGVDIVYHLAGVNRPQTESEFEEGNVSFTRELIDNLVQMSQKPTVVFSSSIQAELDNPYGLSKKKAEDLLTEYQSQTGAPVYIYRLPGVFGKWSRPNYNTVVATFCHNIARGLGIQVSDPERVIELAYIDDVVKGFVGILSKPVRNLHYCQVTPTYEVSLGDLAELIYSFRNSRTSLHIPDFQDRFNQCLYATYLSFLPEDDFSYHPELKSDQRGNLAELIKSPHFGQIFVSTTRPGITRGNHYHNTKTEKFIVVKGQADIYFRHIHSDQVLTYRVSGGQPEIVDIPPGYTHSIKNVGEDELVVLFWANQVFDPDDPDTYFCEVER